VGASLVATVAHFNGPAWTPELAADWKAAYDLVAQVMTGAADEDAGVRPAFWEATVIAHELRRFDIATFRVATTEPLHYLLGQSVSMESAERPRIWCFYSPANVPHDDLTMDFHVRVLPQRPADTRSGAVDQLPPARFGRRGLDEETQITPGVAVRAAERHRPECRLLRHLPIHVDIVGIRCQKRIGQNLAAESSAAAMIAGAPPKRSKRLMWVPMCRVVAGDPLQAPIPCRHQGTRP
jgi:hypothetical protein